MYYLKEKTRLALRILIDYGNRWRADSKDYNEDRLKRFRAARRGGNWSRR